MNAAKKLEIIKCVTISFLFLLIGLLIGMYVESVRQKNKPFVAKDFKIDSVENISRLSSDDSKRYCAHMLERQYRPPFLKFDELKNTAYETNIKILEVNGISITRENIWCAARFKISTFNGNRETVSISDEKTVWFQLAKPTRLELRGASKEEFEEAVKVAQN